MPFLSCRTWSVLSLRSRQLARHRRLELYWHLMRDISLPGIYVAPTEAGHARHEAASATERAVLAVTLGA